MKQVSTRITSLLLAFLLLLSITAHAESPPVLPDGDIQPLPVSLPGGLKFEVRTGPGEEYAKSGTVSTNGWVQVFGWEEGPGESGRAKWLFVQYATSGGRMRFGYVLADNLDALQKGMRPLREALPLDELRVLGGDAPLTDDPLGAGKPLRTLAAGTQAIRLARMGEWAYVEAADGEGPVRGFVTDSSLADAAWRDESRPFDLRAASWAPMARDYAATREQYTAYRDDEFGGYERALNVWLRLDSTESRAALERLSDFKVTAGRAACARMPIGLSSVGYTDEGEEWLTLHFMPKTGFSRAALDVVLEEGESIENVTISCTRTRLDGTAETLALPLAGVPMDMGFPAGGAAFTAKTYTPFGPRAGEEVTSLGDYLEQDLGQPMPDLPEHVRSLPSDTDEYALYLLEGTIRKQPGPFGVYDVVFSLENAPEGVYLAAYQECGECFEIDAFDMIAADVILPTGLRDPIGDDGRMGETLERGFAILLLADADLWQGEELQAMVRGLRVNATFSGEKWDMSYEQHGTTSAIGPRSAERVNLGEVVLGEGKLNEIP